MVIAVLLGTVLQLTAQGRRIDSLRARLKELPQQDTARIFTLLRLGERIVYSDYETALECYAEAKKYGEAHDDRQVLALVGTLYGELYNKLYLPDAAMENALEGLELHTANRDTFNMARTNNALGLIQHELENFEQAKQYYLAAERLYESIGADRGVFVARHNFAVTLTDEGDTVNARRYYHESMPRLLKSRYTEILGATYNNLGNLLPRTSEADSAIYYFQLALAIKRRGEQPRSTANTYLNVAEAYLRLNALDRAQAYLDSAAQHLEGMGVFDLLINYHRYTSELLRKQGKTDAAFFHLDEALRLKDSLYSEERTVQAQQMGAVYKSKDQESRIALLAKQSDIDKAETSRLWAVSIALGAGFLAVGALLTVTIIRGRERKRMYELLSKKNQEIERQQSEILEQNERLAAQNRRLEEMNRDKDGLISIVAHDLRAPLNRSAALAELISSSGPLNPEQIKYLGMIHKVNDDGGRLIQDLLEMNSYENLDFRIDRQPVDLRELLERTVRGFEKVAQDKAIALHIQVPTEPVEAATDEKLLGRVIDNLLSNAIKFTKPGKNVYLQVERQNGHAHVVVRDEGQGISVEDQKKMFRKFQRLSARPTGGESSTGLGLSIVKTLIERLDGEIDLASEVGKGTEFRIKLPRKSRMEES